MLMYQSDTVEAQRFFTLFASFIYLGGEVDDLINILVDVSIAAVISGTVYAFIFVFLSLKSR